MLKKYVKVNKKRRKALLNKEKKGRNMAKNVDIT